MGTASPITKNFLTENVNNIKIEKFLYKNKISQRRQEQPGRINRVFIDSEEACGLLFHKGGKPLELEELDHSFIFMAYFKGRPLYKQIVTDFEKSN